MVERRTHKPLTVVRLHLQAPSQLSSEAEQRFCKAKVVGSIPTAGSIFFPDVRAVTPREQITKGFVGEICPGVVSGDAHIVPSRHQPVREGYAGSSPASHTNFVRHA